MSTARLSGHDTAIIANALRQKARDDRVLVASLRQGISEADLLRGINPRPDKSVEDALLNDADRADELADLIDNTDHVDVA